MPYPSEGVSSAVFWDSIKFGLDVGIKIFGSILVVVSTD
jgi:hypothetical protein